ncbi:hypothetical protein EPUS_03807 [Endocarpon pusillum Z07020]|uniref:Myb-like domain-containing protein n=1 Tax=Endocarpon pusillum (strain Z07020 / HMAS-L-300199) TaxID=1263415 RepID=U1GNW3_ENDPU|nr:uncharacterized protein EPUS_03807 [Endocarpon pusillum Z07020]ERF73993.1 hypothetical protein EPUS_03807 [Endocarpon pusillum Z07020]
MKRSRLWADDSELDLQLFKVAAVQTLPNGRIEWPKVARFVADGQFTQASCRSRFYYCVNQGGAFCREIEAVQTAVRAAPGAVQPRHQDQWGKSGREIAKEVERQEDESDNTSNSTSDSEAEERTQVSAPAGKKSKWSKKQKNDNIETRKEKKKRFRKQNKVDGGAASSPASSALCSGALPPLPAKQPTVDGRDSRMSNIAEIAQTEILKAIGNALLQKVGQ